MTDAIEGAVYSIISAVTGAGAVYFGYRAFSDGAKAHWILSAVPLGSAVVGAATQLAAVSGEVRSSAPVKSMNGTDAATVREQVETRTYSTSDPIYAPGQRRVLSTTWRESTAWSIASRPFWSEAALPAPSAPPMDASVDPVLPPLRPAEKQDSVMGVYPPGGSSAEAQEQAGTVEVEVARDAVRRAWEKDPSSVSSALAPAGMMLEPSAGHQSSLLVFLRFLMGRIDDGPWRVQHILPIGMYVTVLGRADGRVGSSVRIGPHPALGFFMFDSSGYHSLSSALSGFSRKFTFAALLNSILAAACAVPALIAAERALYVYSDSYRRLTDGPVAAQVQRDAAGQEASARTVSQGFGMDTRAAAPEEQCIVCMDNKRCIAAAPCGHVSMCAACAGRFTVRQRDAGRGVGACPLCRQPITQLVRLYNQA